MALDASILLGSKPAQIDSPVENYGKFAQIQGAIQGNQLNAMKMDEYKRNVDRESQLRQILQGTDPTNPDATYSAILKTGDIKGAGDFQKQRLEGDKYKTEIEKHKAETEKIRAEKAMLLISHGTSALSEAKDPASYALIRNMLAQNPDYATLVKGLPEQFDPVAIQAKIAEGMAVKDKIKLAIDKATLDQTVVRDANTKAHQDVTGKAALMSAGAAGASANAAQQNAKTNAERLALDRDAPQYIQTDNGLVAVPKKPGVGPITGQVVTGSDGQPIQKPLKDIPAAVNTAIVANNQSLRTLNNTISLLEGKKVGNAQGDANATGVKGYLPNGLLNRFDPEGVDTRAGISDIGSLKIHDRSGAAVTVSESPRLMPFIPLATDDAVTARKKLVRLRDEMAAMQNDLGEVYGKDQGYKPNPVLKRQDTAPAPTPAAIPGQTAAPANLPTATNAQGQKVVLKDGKWQPL